MKKQLQNIIIKECNKQIRHSTLRTQRQRILQTKFTKRTGIGAETKKDDTPLKYKLDKHFNPYYVRSNSGVIADSITNKIKQGTYKPNPALTISIRKHSGGEREINIFTIPDAAVSKYLFKVILKKNNLRLSPYSYAYRTDRNAHDAVEHIYAAIKDLPRCYLVEYDFSHFFDSIRHEYVIEILKSKFYVTKSELDIIKLFLHFEKADAVNYAKGIMQTNLMGVPTGTAISMLLANIACHEVDKKIERSGGILARFSDDSVIVCEDYNTAIICEAFMHAHGERSGTVINIEKSPGISLLTQNAGVEPVKAKENLDFLGYNISHAKISLKDATIKRIKQRITEIINWHLIFYPKRYRFSPKRYDSKSKIDWDLVTCINEMRRYIYGRVTESKLNKCLSDNSEPLVATRNVFSNFPLITDTQILKQLDGWLCYTLHQALNVRAKLLTQYIGNYERPIKKQLITGEWYKSHLKNETKLPSFYKSWMYVQKLRRVHNLGHFPTTYY